MTGPSRGAKGGHCTYSLGDEEIAVEKRFIKTPERKHRYPITNRTAMFSNFRAIRVELLVIEDTQRRTGTPRPGIRGFLNDNGVWCIIRLHSVEASLRI